MTTNFVISNSCFNRSFSYSTKEPGSSVSVLYTFENSTKCNEISFDPDSF